MMLFGNVKCPLTCFIMGLLWMMVTQSVAAQVPSDDSFTKAAVVALPLPSDVGAFARVSSGAFSDTPASNRFSDAGYYGRRVSDGMSISVNVAVCVRKEDAEDVAFGLVPLSGIRPPEGTFTGRRIGQKAWAARGGHLLYVTDGRAAIAIHLLQKVQFDENGRPAIRAVLDQDRQMAERIAVKMLHRLQALGATSQPAANAPEWAKKEVAARLAELRRVEAEKASQAGPPPSAQSPRP